MRFFGKRVAAILCAAVSIAAGAADTATKTLLIQIGGDAHFKVWYGTGETQFTEDELADLTASAKPEGGAPINTAAGPASAVDTGQGIVIRVPQAKTDKTLLVDRDNCGGVKFWHAAGTTTLTEDQLTELALTALPGGGKNLAFGEFVARGYTAPLGVVAVIWKPVKR